MSIQHTVKLEITLRPTTTEPAQVLIAVDKDQRLLTVDQPTTINFDYTAKTHSQLIVELINQQAQEGVEIVGVSLFDITDPKFAWTGVYTPIYPEPWATQQQNQGVVLKQHLCPHTYLSWPGKWTLTFTVPVFTWIHQVQDLGWVYD